MGRKDSGLEKFGEMRCGEHKESKISMRKRQLILFFYVCWRQYRKISIYMNLRAQIAKHLRKLHFGGNWTSVDLKETLADVAWQEATTKIDSLNTMAALVFHINYYTEAILKVLLGRPLDAKDKYSFDLPPLQSQEDWKKLLGKMWTDAESLILLIEQVPESRLEETFANEKYGSVYRNLQGLIEHTHYHLGQIVLIKKLLPTTAK